MNQKNIKIRKNVLIKISIAFIFTILLFFIKEYVPPIQEDIILVVSMFVLFGLLYLSINKDILKWNVIQTEREDLVNTIFKKIPHPLGIFYVDD